MRTVSNRIFEELTHILGEETLEKIIGYGGLISIDGEEEFEEEKLLVQDELTISRNKVIDTLNSKILLLEELEEEVARFNRSISKLNELKKLLKFHENNESLNEINHISQLLLEESGVTEEISDAKNKIDEYNKKFITVQKLKKLLNFIGSDCGNELNQNHINTFKNIPDLTSEELEEFDYYEKKYNKIVLEKRTAILLEQERREKERLEKVVKNETIKNVDLKKEEQIVIDSFSYYEEEIEEIFVYEPHERSKILFGNLMIGNSLKDIETLFPKCNDSLYYLIKNDLIDLLTEEIDNVYKIIEEDNNNKEYIELALEYESYLEEVFNYFKVIETTQNEDVQEETKTNIFFSKTPSGKHYIFDDIEDLEDNKKQDVLILIDKLINSNFTTNPTQQKKFINNKRLRGIFELKRPNIRLIYKDLGNKNYYVLSVFKKYSNYDKEIAQFITERNRICKKDFLNIQATLNEEKELKLIKEENQKIIDELNSKILPDKQIKL